MNKSPRVWYGGIRSGTLIIDELANASASTGRPSARSLRAAGKASRASGFEASHGPPAQTRSSFN